MKIKPKVSVSDSMLSSNFSPRQWRFGVAAWSRAVRGVSPVGFGLQLWWNRKLDLGLCMEQLMWAGCFRGEKLLLNCSNASERFKLKVWGFDAFFHNKREGVINVQSHWVILLIYWTAMLSLSGKYDIVFYLWNMSRESKVQITKKQHSLRFSSSWFELTQGTWRPQVLSVLAYILGVIMCNICTSENQLRYFSTWLVVSLVWPPLKGTKRRCAPSEKNQRRWGVCLKSRPRITEDLCRNLSS